MRRRAANRAARLPSLPRKPDAPAVKRRHRARREGPGGDKSMKKAATARRAGPRQAAARAAKHAGDEAPDLRQALATAPAARAAWDDLTPIARRDFMSWIDAAKQARTRQRRIRIACENLAAGKRRPCCYAVVPLDLYSALGAATRNARVAKAQWSVLTPDERRDFCDWIEAAEERESRKARIEGACAMLAEGKKMP